MIHDDDYNDIHDDIHDKDCCDNNDCSYDDDLKINDNDSVVKNPNGRPDQCILMTMKVNKMFIIMINYSSCDKMTHLALDLIPSLYWLKLKSRYRGSTAVHSLIN